MLEICSPSTENDFHQYYQLRYDILRKPWNQPLGSEKDHEEEIAFHICAKYNNIIVGACRIQFLDNEIAQIRYMCTSEAMKYKGIGKKMLAFAENHACENKIQKIILHARENAVDFYKKSGYNIIEPSYMLFGSIPHYLMDKKLKHFE
jgi:N-acetylglutamate synthase-like GNAT family acetyltransferase